MVSCSLVAARADFLHINFLYHVVQGHRQQWLLSLMLMMMESFVCLIVEIGKGLKWTRFSDHPPLRNRLVYACIKSNVLKSYNC